MPKLQWGLVIGVALAVALLALLTSQAANAWRSRTAPVVPPAEGPGGGNGEALAPLSAWREAVGPGVPACRKVSASTISAPRIFVSIPAYRDPEVGHTLRSLFLMADNPRAIDVGLCLQGAPGEDGDGLADYLRLAKEGADGATFESQVFVKRLAHTAATGPTKARALIEKELLPLSTADYVLMVDSHTLFLQGWDTYLRKALQEAGEDSTILSTYAPQYFREQRNAILESTSLSMPRTSYFMFFNEFLGPANFPRFDSRPCAATPPAAFASVGWAAGFSFARRSVHIAVPYVDLPWLFFGEEHLMHARFHTHGYLVQTPPLTPLLTNFDRSYRRTFVADAEERRGTAWRAEYNATLRRVAKVMAGMAPDEGLLGGRRSLDDFVNHVGVDMTRQEVDAGKAAGIMEEDPFRQAPEIAFKHGSQEAFDQLHDRFA